ncbi:MAG: LLM class flavin-dependent oxidoreductase [Actinobacteria bacterium]|nr:LLM class flavin-dependent oxidoreductase [Actinomycetota bacterium]
MSTTHHRLEYGLQTSGHYNGLLTAAKWAETRGLVAFAVPDHYLMALNPEAEVPALDGLVQLAGLARETTSIELSVVVSPITFRHPSVLYKTGVTIADMSGGRFKLGVGTGWLDREHEIYGIPYPDMKERFARLEDALAYIAAALRNEAHDGPFYSLEEFTHIPAPEGGLPLLVGGLGKRKTPRLAGTYAAEFNCYPGPLDEFAAKIQVARDSASDAGRSPDDMMISTSGAVLAAETQEEFDELFAAEATAAGLTPEELESHYAKRNTPRGTYEQVRQQLGDFADLGVTRFYLQTGNADLDAIGDLLDAIMI